MCPRADDACVTYDLIDPAIVGGRCVAPERTCAIVTCSAGRRCSTLGTGQIVCQC